METRDPHCYCLLIIALFVATLTSCGRPAHELETAPVSGRVTLDGKPLPQGIVYILPTKGRMSKGLIQEDGSFILSTYDDGDGAQVGTHAATIAALPMDELDSPQLKKLRVPVPSRYSRPGTSGLTVDVKSGEHNEVEWNLTSSDP